MRDELTIIHECEMAAEWCARRKLTGAAGDSLPDGIGSDSVAYINENQEWFRETVRSNAYALSMTHSEEGHNNYRQPMDGCPLCGPSAQPRCDGWVGFNGTPELL